MNTKHRVCKQSTVAVAFGALILATLVAGGQLRAWGQDTLSRDNAPDIIRNSPGYPIDASTQRVIFSGAASLDVQAKFRDEPRFWIQLFQRQRRQLNLPEPTFGEQSVFGEQSSEADNPEELSPQPDHPRPRQATKNGAWYQAMDQQYNIDSAHTLPYAAKYVFTNTNSQSCSDWVVFPGPANGSSSTFSMIAFKNLYPTCPGNPTGSTPTVKFAYDVSTKGHAINSSPVISLDGTQVAFTEQGQGVMDILYLPATDSGDSNAYPAPNPMSLLPACNGSYPPTNRPCLYTFTIGSNITTTSFPFVDYGRDTGWFGDDGGNMYSVHPFFLAKPTTGALSPVFTDPSPNKQLSSPTLDPFIGNLFVGDHDGILLKYNYGSGSPTLTGTLVGSSAANVYVEPPLVDITVEQVFTYEASMPSGANNPSVVQNAEGSADFVAFATTPPACSACKVAQLGIGNFGLRLGFWNNAYIMGEDNTGTIPSNGLLYACGNDSGGHNYPELFAMSFTSAGVMNSTPAFGPLPMQTNPQGGTCSPLTENYDGTTDRLFVGLPDHCPVAYNNGEVIGSGNGSTTTFNYTAVNPPVVQNTVSIFVNGALEGTDNGSGSLTGAGIAAGSTVTYSTGALHVVFTSAPPAGTNNITMNYQGLPGSSSNNTGCMESYNITQTSSSDPGFPGITGELIGTGNNSTTTFMHTAAKPPLAPTGPGTINFISILVNGAVEGTDNGSGGLTGSGISSGTVNYTTGAVSVTFKTAPANGASVTMSYQRALTTNPSAGGTTGIIIDNETGPAGDLNIYFMENIAGVTCTKFSGGTDSGSSCAISLTQHDLE